MDDLANRVAGLSLDTKRELVEQWLQTTSVGRHFPATISRFAEDARSGQYERDTLAQALFWTQKHGRNRIYQRSMPPLLYALVFGKEGEKELREDEVLKELLLKEDPISFVLNSCAERTSALLSSMPTNLSSFL
jgi:hypothetical protein